MTPDVLIVGQGLAGTLLGWACEQAAIRFRVADASSAHSASAVAAGIINPITGQRLVKSWRADTLVAPARQVYRAIEAELATTVWREMRIRRRFANDREREIWARKSATGELAPFVGAADADGFWIEGGAQVETATLLARMRDRWLARGQLMKTSLDLADEIGRYEVVIDCRGPGATRRGGAFDFVPWEFSKGELIEAEVEGLVPDVILNRGHWVLPLGEGRALVGATHEPGCLDPTPTEAAALELQASAEALTGRSVNVRRSRCGIRVNVPDKRPVVGRHPSLSTYGVACGLGAKGALWAPLLATQWVQHLTTGTAFDPEIDVRRWVVGQAR